jgi:hypothetical protein
MASLPRTEISTHKRSAIYTKLHQERGGRCSTQGNGGVLRRVARNAPENGDGKTLVYITIAL